MEVGLDAVTFYILIFVYSYILFDGCRVNITTMIKPVQFFKCLSDETRLHATLLIYLEGELCVCELMDALDDSQPKISRHLAQLRQCGILTDARRGQWVFYSVEKNLPAWASEVLDIGSKASEEDLAAFQSNLKAMKNRPQCC